MKKTLKKAFLIFTNLLFFISSISPVPAFAASEITFERHQAGPAITPEAAPARESLTATASINGASSNFDQPLSKPTRMTRVSLSQPALLGQRMTFKGTIKGTSPSNIPRPVTAAEVSPGFDQRRALGNPSTPPPTSTNQPGTFTLTSNDEEVFIVFFAAGNYVFQSVRTNGYLTQVITSDGKRIGRSLQPDHSIKEYLITINADGKPSLTLIQAPTTPPAPQQPPQTSLLEVRGDIKIDTHSKIGGTSAFFDGSGDYLSLADRSDFDLSGGVWTIDFWVYPTSFSGGNVIYAQNSGNYANSTSIHVDGGGQVYFLVSAAGETVVSLTDASAVLNLNAWQHVAVVENADRYYLFIDGVLKAALTSETDRPANETGPLLIGAGDIGNALSQFHKGNIDEFRISKGNARWTSSFVPPSTLEQEGSAKLLHFTKEELGNASPVTPVPPATPPAPTNPSLPVTPRPEQTVLANDGEEFNVTYTNGIYTFQLARTNQVLSWVTAQGKTMALVPLPNGSNKEYQVTVQNDGTLTLTTTLAETPGPTTPPATPPAPQEPVVPPVTPPAQEPNPETPPVTPPPPSNPPAEQTVTASDNEQILVNKIGAFYTFKSIRLNAPLIQSLTPDGNITVFLTKQNSSKTYQVNVHADGTVTLNLIQPESPDPVTPTGPQEPPVPPIPPAPDPTTPPPAPPIQQTVTANDGEVFNATYLNGNYHFQSVDPNAAIAQETTLQGSTLVRLVRQGVIKEYSAVFNNGTVLLTYINPNAPTPASLRDEVRQALTFLGPLGQPGDQTPITELVRLLTNAKNSLVATKTKAEENGYSIFAADIDTVIAFLNVYEAEANFSQSEEHLKVLIETLSAAEANRHLDEFNQKTASLKNKFPSLQLESSTIGNLQTSLKKMSLVEQVSVIGVELARLRDPFKNPNLPDFSINERRAMLLNFQAGYSGVRAKAVSWGVWEYFPDADKAYNQFVTEFGNSLQG